MLMIVFVMVALALFGLLAFWSEQAAHMRNLERVLERSPLVVFSPPEFVPGVGRVRRPLAMVPVNFAGAAWS